MSSTFVNTTQPDGWDIWQFLSYVATGLSIVALLSSGKQSKELGQAGTVLGVGSSALHKLAAPPRCSQCRCRMTRLQAHPTLAWWCHACGYGMA
jgi:hypothetical protein